MLLFLNWRRYSLDRQLRLGGVCDGGELGDEVLGFAKTGGGDAAVLFVGDRDTLAGARHELFRNGVFVFVRFLSIT